MISVLEHPRPHKNLSLPDAHPSSTSIPRANLRAHSLPTPAPSPSPSHSSTSSSSTFSSPLANMLALGNPATSFAPFSRSFSPFAPAFNPSQPRMRGPRHCVPVTPDSSYMSLPTMESEQLESFRNSKSRVVRLCSLPLLPEAAMHALASLFPFFSPTLRSSGGGAVNDADKPTPMRMWTLSAKAGARDGERPVWAVFACHEEALAALSLAVYDSGNGCGSVSVVPALESELEPFTKLQPFNPSLQSSDLNRSTPSAVMGMQTLMRYPPSPTSTNETEAEAELFFPDAQDDFKYAYGLGNGTGQARGVGCGSWNGSTLAAMMQEQSTMQSLQTMQTCDFQLSTNPPKARTGFRHGDWICAVPVCAAHNFGRNVSCIQCAAPRPSNLTLIGGIYAHPPVRVNGQSSAHGMRNASPRFASPMSNQAQVQVQAQTRLAQQQRQQQQQQQLAKAQAQAQAQAQAHPLLTPSGRAFAAGGKVQNVSPDPLAPCILFWPDNEAYPDPGQIRPASLANVHQPPIMNTGNKGPIEHQPGDWVCQKCEYLNWRRRKVCQTCFPYAEGNGDSVSAAMHAERLALLAAVYGQSHPQITNAHAQAALQFPAHAQNLNGSYQFPVASASSQSLAASSNMTPLSSVSNYPFTTPPSTHRSHFPSAPSPARRTPIPGLSVSTSVTNPRPSVGGDGGRMAQPFVARRAASTPDTALGGGNIVYQTPPSPAAARPPPSLSSSLALTCGGSSPHMSSPPHTGPLLPSFLKHEVQPLRTIPRPPFTGTVSGTGAGTRTPASLSPASSTSADLPFDEHDGPAKAVGVIGSGRSAGFYAHPRGAGSGSSMSSSSSLTLAGGSIWSLERDEDKAWNGAFANVEALKGLTL